MIRIINKLKAVQRRRSKSNCRKMNSGKAKKATSLTTSSTSASSCVSIDYSALSDISSREAADKGVVKERAECVTRKMKVFPSVPRKKKVICSPHMRRRAEAILKVLSCHGCASEVRIRQLLGDSPDTSKALRMLISLSFSHTHSTEHI
ncbi:uncharacterized protein LOC132060997 [Lycium ferocissimum]|uniref:uncharacterized protein LOC132060997 n=1 Tax=Lycium ferocissimum TaxID=112874 RepID=UPI00281520CF|nr:uncharacterized protein LOC132060997 [Lycium ferocissimum]